MPEIVSQVFHVKVSGTTYHVEVQEAVQYDVSLTSTGSLGLVRSVFGRVGDIVAETGDYEPSQLAQQGATDGQVLTWSNVLGSWVPGTVGGGAVDSVNGQTGAVVLDSDDIDEGLTNLYFTEARANAASDVVANTSARHTHANKAELDLVSDGDHDVRTDNPHGVTAAQIDAAEEVHTHVVDDITDWATADLSINSLTTNLINAGDINAGPSGLSSAGGIFMTAGPNDILDMGGSMSIRRVLSGSQTGYGEMQFHNANVPVGPFMFMGSSPYVYLSSSITGTPTLWFARTPGAYMRRVASGDIEINPPLVLGDDLQVGGDIVSVAGTHPFLDKSANLTDVADQQTALNNLTAVSGATDEYVLTKDTSTGDAVWKAASTVAAIADLTDVVITSPADNEVLAYDTTSGDWINQTAAEAGLAAASHVHAAADVTSGTFDDARIAESNITQHESAITHQNLSGAGTNTHAQIDAHLALTDEHIDWTNATADLETTGVILSTFDGLSSGSAFFADLDVTASGNYTNVVNGFDLDYDLDMASSSIVTGTVRGVRFRYNAVDNGALYASPVVQIIDGRINAGGVQVANATGSNPMYYKFENPAASQQFPEGFMRVDVTGGSAAGTTIAFFSSCAVSGSQDGIGYRGYATGSGAATGTLVGTQGYVLLGASANQSDVAALDGRIVGSGSTPADKIMGMRCVRHALVRQGSLVVTSALVDTPNAVSSTHLDFLNDQGDAYIAGNAEVDGELYCDGNVAHSLVDVSAASVAAGDETYIIGDASSTAIVVDLPAISGLSGHREYCIKKTDGSGNTVTVSAAVGDTIDGSGSVVLSSQYDYVRVVAGNGTDWHVVG